jgi:hypothetical protein
MGQSNKSTSEFEEIHVENCYSGGKTRSCKVTRARKLLIFAVSHVCLPHEGAYQRSCDAGKQNKCSGSVATRIFIWGPTTPTLSTSELYFASSLCDSNFCKDTTSERYLASSFYANNFCKDTISFDSTTSSTSNLVSELLLCITTNTHECFGNAWLSEGRLLDARQKSQFICIKLQE